MRGRGFGPGAGRRQLKPYIKTRVTAMVLAIIMYAAVILLAWANSTKSQHNMVM